jgi:hypothetical protein
MRPWPVPRSAHRCVTAASLRAARHRQLLSSIPTLHSYPVSQCYHRRHFSTSTSEPIAPSPVRVRYAPSPTGSVHLGGLRTALYNFLLSRQHPDGAFIIRIEDTDQKRLVSGAVDQLLRVLQWAGIRHNEGHPLTGTHAPPTPAPSLPSIAAHRQL